MSEESFPDNEFDVEFDDDGDYPSGRGHEEKKASQDSKDNVVDLHPGKENANPAPVDQADASKNKGEKSSSGQPSKEEKSTVKVEASGSGTNLISKIVGGTVVATAISALVIFTPMISSKIMPYLGFGAIPEWQNATDELHLKIISADQNIASLNQAQNSLLLKQQHFQAKLIELQALEQTIANNKLALEVLNEELGGLVNGFSSLKGEIKGQVQGSDEVRSTLSGRLEFLGTWLEEIQSQSDTLSKNNGWLFNRLDKLEAWREEVGPQIKNTEQAAPDTFSKSKAFSTGRAAISKKLKPKMPWKFVASNDSVAFIINKNSAQRLRVTVGFEVPKCGVVESIDPVKQIVKTNGCTIVRD